MLPRCQEKSWTRYKVATVNLDDPATTLALTEAECRGRRERLFWTDGKLQSVGIQCALCHSTVDQSFSTTAIPPGNIGNRLDGWPNRDLNVGAIIASAPTVKPFADLLSVDEATVRKVLMSWGPGKFDAELILDGKPSDQTASRRRRCFPPHSGCSASASILIPDGEECPIGMRLLQISRWEAAAHFGIRA